MAQVQGPEAAVSDTMDTKKRLTLHILSDSVGETADTVARILAIQFPQFNVNYEFTTMIDSLSVLHDAVCPHSGKQDYIFVYTFTNPELRHEMHTLVAEEDVHGVDVVGAGIDLLTRLTGEEPSGDVGILHQVDRAYFRRIAAMEYAVNHDDGQLPETLPEADVVLIGVSRTSKTPLAMYLALRGYKTANIPLALESPPPEELFQIDPRRIFGLITNIDTVVRIRTERMKEIGSYVPGYAEEGRIEEEVAAARALMRQLGVLVINTDSRAIESVAQEIITHLRAL